MIIKPFSGRSATQRVKLNPIPIQRRFRLGNAPLRWLTLTGVIQLVLWVCVAAGAELLDENGYRGQGPYLFVFCLLIICFLVYLASLALLWKPSVLPDAAGQLGWVVLAFAVAFRVVLWWSQPIQERDLYRYLWDGRVFCEGINPYRYSPAQIDQVRDTTKGNTEIKRLRQLLKRAPEVHRIFNLVEHRNVPTIYPPFSEAVFAVTAIITPENSSLRFQVGVLKGVILLFDFATIGLLVGLLKNLGQPPTLVLAYAWCPLVIKEFSNSGHLDAIAVCLTVALFWVLTLPNRVNGSISVSAGRDKVTLRWRDWLAVFFWGFAVLAKLYPIVLAPLLFTFWWRRVRWRTFGLFTAFVFVISVGYTMLAIISNAKMGNDGVSAQRSNFSGLGQFFQHWEMNDLAFSLAYENTRLPAQNLSEEHPWYSILPAEPREWLNQVLTKIATLSGLEFPKSQLAFLFTQALAASTLILLTVKISSRPWPEDKGETLIRRSFLCLAAMWYLSATQNPWYWIWALPFVVFVSRAWLLVSGFSFLYYLRCWLSHSFPESTLPGALTGLRFFDEVVVFLEHLPPLLMVCTMAWHHNHNAKLAAESFKPSEQPPVHAHSPEI